MKGKKITYRTQIIAKQWTKNFRDNTSNMKIKYYNAPLLPPSGSQSQLLAGHRPLPLAPRDHVQCACVAASLCLSVSASRLHQSACLVLAEHRLGLELEMQGWRMLDWGIGEQLFTRQVGMGISGMIGLHMGWTKVEKISLASSRMPLYPSIGCLRSSPWHRVVDVRQPELRKKGCLGSGGEHTNSWGSRHLHPCSPLV